MGFKIIAQLTLIVASVVIVLTFIQPSLAQMKTTQDELFQYSEAVAKASQLNTRLRELISVRDSFADEDIAGLEKLLPSEIDHVSVMRNIEGIFASKDITITSLIAQEPVDPVNDIVVEDPIIVQTQENNSLAYQDFEVTFTGTYWQLRDVLFLTEMSDALLEVADLEFGVSNQDDEDDEGDTPILVDNNGEQYSFAITFRTYSLPVKNI